VQNGFEKPDKGRVGVRIPESKRRVRCTRILTHWGTTLQSLSFLW